MPQANIDAVEKQPAVKVKKRYMVDRDGIWETFSKPAQCTDKLEKVTSNQSFKTFLI